ncbi:MAG: hypothetical protein D3908_00325 [Candidatus Electrothrix sp. AUS4]|nr:hypothetical protein [Candidatus Electrothrix sp. AUS4]
MCWGWWFFSAPAYRYVSSTKIEITRDEQPVWRIPEGGERPEAYDCYNLSVFFSPSDFRKIKPGQKAFLTVGSTDTLPWRPFTAQVETLDPSGGRVNLRLEIPVKVSSQLAGVTLEKVEIAVSQQTPASFLFHTVHSNSGG